MTTTIRQQPGIPPNGLTRWAHVERVLAQTANSRRQLWAWARLLLCVAAVPVALVWLWACFYL